jgi:hypothetical protein
VSKMEARMTWLSARRPRRAARVADRAPWDWYADSCSRGKLPGGCSTHPSSILRPPPFPRSTLTVTAPIESALTLCEQRGILRPTGIPCLRRILRFGLHPHESRKTSQTVDRRIPFVNKCFSRFDRARHGRGVSSSPGPPASRGGIPLASQHLSATASPARKRAFFLLRLLENTGRQAGHLISRAARPEGRLHRAKPIPHDPAIDTSGARSGPIGQISGS